MIFNLLYIDLWKIHICILFDILIALTLGFSTKYYRIKKIFHLKIRNKEKLVNIV